ncbi:hypothetical protein LG288_05925 [Idiomarina seosinensis]|uniref:hypothetical protein n=1 Tax=Idiomarina seosinensis TaxID=281739 RepID=UPI00384A7AFA
MRNFAQINESNQVVAMVSGSRPPEGAIEVSAADILGAIYDSETGNFTIDGVVVAHDVK